MVEKVWIVTVEEDFFEGPDGNPRVHSVHMSERSAKDCLRGMCNPQNAPIVMHGGGAAILNGDWYSITEWEIRGCKEEKPAGTPAHYKGGLVFQVIDAYDLGFYFGNVIKYVCRHKQKGGLDDLRKAKDYLDREIRKMEETKE